LLIKNEYEIFIEKVFYSIRTKMWIEFVPILLDVFHTNKNEYVRAQAIHVYSSLNDNAGHQLLPGLDKLSTELKTAILSGLIKSEDLHGRVAAEQRLVGLISSNIKEDKILACKIIEELEQESLNKPIAEFMRDPDPEVKFAAIQAAGKIKNPKLIPPLLGLLESNFKKKHVVLALSKFGDESVVAVKNYLQKHPSPPDDMLNELIVMLEKIESPLASGTLVSLLNYPVAEIRHRVLDALNSINHEEPLTETKLFHELLDNEFRFVYRILYALNERSTARELRQPLGYELQKSSERVFDILGLLYNRDIVKRAEAALQLAGKEKKANALEILDHIIPKKTHDILVGLVDNISREERLTRLKKFASDDRQPLAVQIIQQGREHYSDWTVATALRTTPVSDGTYIFIVPYLESKNTILKQGAISALRQLYKSDPVHFNTLQNTFKLNHDDIMKEKESTRLSDIEKVFVLKSTDLFSGTPENVIAEIVPIVKEEFVSKNQVIFHKGDSGSSMYIIYEGEIKIHDGDKVYAMLGSRDFFGELALLDPEPRSASATANTDTLLLKLDEEEAYELMEERTEVLKSIMRILCRRIRNQNEKISRMPVATG
jgi:HEAT repeat protein